MMLAEVVDGGGLLWSLGLAARQAQRASACL